MTNSSGVAIAEDLVWRDGVAPVLPVFELAILWKTGPPPVCVIADSKGLAGRFLVSAYSKGLLGAKRGRFVEAALYRHGWRAKPATTEFSAFT